MLKKIILMCLLILGTNMAFADGGFTQFNCTVTRACPAGQTGSITYQVRASSNIINGCNDTKGINLRISQGYATQISNTCASAVSFSYTGYENSTSACPAGQNGVINIQRSYEVWSDGSSRNFSGWYETSRTCSTPISYSYTGYENSTSACPATQPNGVINIQRSYEVWSDGSARNFSGWYETSRNCSAVLSYYGYENSSQACPATQPNGVIKIQRRYEVWTDGTIKNYSGWYETSRTCVATLSYKGYNNSTSACPSTQPTGVINIQQSYEVWTDGTVKNYSGWYETSRTCVAVYKTTETEYQALACSSNGGEYKEGGNGISQKRSREVWSDGARAWIAWSTTANTCYKTVADTQAQKTYSCAEGQIGKIVKEPRRTHIEYASDANKTQDEKNKLQDKTATAWIEYVITNTCSNVPDSTWSEKGSRNVTCESVKGAGYTGTATQTGTYYYSYSSVTKKTTSYFDVSSTDISACYNTTSVNDVTMETKIDTCPDGQTGNTTSYRYATTDSNNKTTYTAYQLLSTNCALTKIADDDLNTDSTNDKAKGILANTLLKASDANAVQNFTQFIKSVDAKNIDSDIYTLNIIVDDLNNYNLNGISGAINAYQGKLNSSGNNGKVKIFLPKDLSKYSETKSKKDVKTYGFQHTVLNNDGTVSVTYTVYGNGLATSNTTKTFKTKILNNINDISTIQVN